MKRFKKESIYIFHTIIILSFICVFSGFTLFYLNTKDRIAPNVYLKTIHIGKLNTGKTSELLYKQFNDQTKGGHINIKFQNKSYNIKYSDIGVTLDQKASLDLVYGSGKLENFINNLYGHFGFGKRTVYTVIKFDENKLINKLREIASSINRKPENAQLLISGSRVTRKPEIPGLEMDFVKALSKVEREALIDMNSNIEFNASEIRSIKPEITLNDYKDKNVIISQYSTAIFKNKKSIIKAVNAINGLILRPGGTNSDKSEGVFSFNNALEESKIYTGKYDEGYNQVASTLYASVLNIGIDGQTIKRTSHESITDYIEPGLDTVIGSNKNDFSFKNTLNSSIVILAEVKGNFLTISLIGGKPLVESRSEIFADVVQVKKPQSQEILNIKKDPGYLKIINEGKDGFKVRVYRIHTENGKVVEKEYLYEEEYKPVKRVIEYGPDYFWSQNDQK